MARPVVVPTRSLMSTTTTPIQLRASSLKDCPRKAVYGGLGTPERDITEAERRRMFRGRIVEAAYAEWLADEHPDWELELQKKIPWAFGIAHADIYALPSRILFEVLSSHQPGEALIRAKLLQLVLELEYCREAESGVLVVLSGDMDEERIPVKRGTNAYQDLAAEVADRIGQVKAWAETGELPRRVCRKPSDAIGHFCRHAQWCFQGWEPPALAEVDSPDARRTASAMWHAKEQERALKAQLREVEEWRKRLETDLGEHVPAGKWRVGPLEISRTHVQRSPTVDLRKAELAGYPVDTLDEFMRPGAEYDTWRLDRVTDDPIAFPDDFGEDAPF